MPDTALAMAEHAFTSDESASARAAAQAFMTSIHVGDAEVAWACFADAAKQDILRRGVDRGMEPHLADRLFTEEATGSERAGFLADLMIGLQKDLELIDIPSMLLEAAAEPYAPDQLRIQYLQEIGSGIGPKVPPLPAGSIIVTLETDSWRVVRLIPRPS